MFWRLISTYLYVTRRNVPVIIIVYSIFVLYQLDLFSLMKIICKIFRHPIHELTHDLAATIINMWLIIHADIDFSQAPKHTYLQKYMGTDFHFVVFVSNVAMGIKTFHYTSTYPLYSTTAPGVPFQVISLENLIWQLHSTRTWSVSCYDTYSLFRRDYTRYCAGWYMKARTTCPVFAYVLLTAYSDKYSLLFCILISISQKFVPGNPIGMKSGLV